MVVVYFRMQKSGKRKEVSTLIQGPKAEWSNDLKRFKPVNAKSKKANKDLDAFEKNVDQVYWKLVNTKGEFDLDMYYLHLTGKVHTYNLIETFDKRIKELEGLVGKEYQASTVTTYRVCRKHLAMFIQKKLNRKDIVLGHLNKGLVKSYYEYLKSIMTVNSANKNMRKFKAILTYAIDNEWMTSNPSKGISLKDEITQKVFFNRERN